MSEFEICRSELLSNEKNLIDEIEAEIKLQNNNNAPKSFKEEKKIFMEQLNDTVQEFDIYKNKKTD